MSKPRIDLDPEPMQGDVVTFQRLAGPTKNDEEKAQISLLLKIKNLEATDIVLTNVKIAVIFSDNSTPFEMSFPVTTRIPAGKSGFWHNRVFTAEAKDTKLANDVAINQNIVVSTLANIIVFKLTFRNFDEVVTKMFALRPHDNTYAFPGKVVDLLWNECWDSAGAVHGESEYGCQLFALDLGVSGWDDKSEQWVRNVYPGKSWWQNENHRIWGKPVYAMADGEVLDVEWNVTDNAAPTAAPPGGSGGNFIRIVTGDEIHGYAHFQKGTIPERLREKGAEVKRGELLGLAGNSGNSTNPHLHIGIEKRRRVIIKGDNNATHILRPMQFNNTFTINSRHAVGVRRTDPWFRNTAHGLSQASNGDACLIWPSGKQPGSPRLSLKEFRCVEETDAEAGSESPYFLVFVGRRFGEHVQSRIGRVRKGAWDDEVDEGELWKVDDEVTGPVDSRTLVLVAMLEEDHDTDVGGENITWLRGEMRKIFADVASDASLSLDQLSALMIPRFTTQINRVATNDEILGVKQLKITTSDGDLPLLKFTGDGAHYNVRFEAIS